MLLLNFASKWSLKTVSFDDTAHVVANIPTAKASYFYLSNFEHLPTIFQIYVKIIAETITLILNIMENYTKLQKSLCLAKGCNGGCYRIVGGRNQPRSVSTLAKSKQKTL